MSEPRQTAIGRGANEVYWNEVADAYQELTRVSCDDFHYGPLIPGDSELGLLPRALDGLRCLELACGGAQNSIVLAKRGARCVAMDASAKQVEHARRLAGEAGVAMETMRCSFAELADRELGRFDLVHSSFGLPFAEDPQAVVAHVAERLLMPGGTLLLSLAHPVSSGEWLEVEDDGDGMFLKSYFDPEPDLRTTAGGECAGSRSYPIGTTVQWILDAGLTLATLVEPKAMDPESRDFAERCPYHSDAWMALAPQLARVPFVYILKATAPA